MDLRQCTEGLNFLIQGTNNAFKSYEITLSDTGLMIAVNRGEMSWLVDFMRISLLWN